MYTGKKYDYTSTSATATELHTEEDMLISHTLTYTNDCINKEEKTLNKSGFSRQILIKVSSMKSNENTLSVSLIYKRTDIQTSRSQQTPTKAPKNNVQVSRFNSQNTQFT
jgi:hypothetical protein